MRTTTTMRRAHGAVLFNCVLAICGCDPKTAEESRFRKILATDPRIENVSIEGDLEDFALYNVFTVSFSIRDKPGSRIILLPYGERDLDKLRILQIGSISPLMLEWHPKLGWVTPRSPTLGDDPTYRPPHPWKDMDLRMLVSRYDEVIEYFSKWPTAPNFETIKTDGGIEVRCRIDPAEESTMRDFIPPGD